MNDPRLQFRVGLFVITAFACAVGLAMRFGEMAWLWEKSYSLAVHFPEAPGVQPGVPVRKNGIDIGKVREVMFDEQRGGVTVIININMKYQLRSDAKVRLLSSLLGDATLEFSPGTSADFVEPGSTLDGLPPTDPVKVVTSLGAELGTTLVAFRETTREWQKVGQNVNSMVETNRGNLQELVAKAAVSMDEFTQTMQSANEYLADKENAASLKKTLAALPRMAEETQNTIVAIRSVVKKMDDNLANLNRVTTPLAKRSDAMMAKLDASVGNMEIMLAELSTFSEKLNDEQGSMRKFMTDPELYRNMNQSASTLNTLLKNL